jgi:hypothetical protein
MSGLAGLHGCHWRLIQVHGHLALSRSPTVLYHGCVVITLCPNRFFVNRGPATIEQRLTF